MRGLALTATLAAACSTGGTGDSEPDASTDGARAPDAPAIVDLDLDGLDDAREDQLARDYLPYLSLDPSDGCPLSGLVARVRKHPADATKILIVYSHLFERDCGLNGHVGDNEAFGVAIDPTLPAPAGILAIRTASHQNTVCERVTECSTCATDGRVACDRAAEGGQMWPVLYASKGKHGQYATRAQCPLLGTCFDQCTLSSARARPPVVNVGEPGVALVHDLTAQGFINATHGWTEATLMAHDPWNSAIDFGDAGNVADDLVDPEFVPGLCP
jgi:hypothetical protein